MKYQQVEDGRERGFSLENAVLFVVGLKVLVHATGVGHLLAVDLWQELGVVDTLLLVEKDVGRVGVNLLRVHFLQRQKQRTFIENPQRSDQQLFFVT